MPFERGTRVRLIGDPNRIGVCTGRSRTWGGRTLHGVDFGGTVSYEPEYHLEELAETPEHPLELLERGRLGRTEDLRRVLTHVRLTGKLTDLIYSMEVSNTDFYAYQFKPVLKMLNSPSNGILIADEVGLGKTIEAGLIWTELKSRFDLRRLMVLCPAMLQEKWQTELLKRFGVKAEIVKAQGACDMLSGRTREDPSDPFAIIASMQGLRPPRGWDADEERRGGGAANLARLLEERRGEEALVDLLVIDEAHYLRNRESQTAALGRLLRDVAEHIVLLSATPIHLRSGDLFQLLNLIDEDTFNHEFAFGEILRANAPLVRLRDLLQSGSLDAAAMAELVREAMNHPLLSESRQLKAIAAAIPSPERVILPDVRADLAYRIETVNLMSNVVTRTRKREVHENRVVREAKAVHLPLNPLEREFYDAVTNAVRQYCSDREFPEGFLLTTPQRQMSSCMAAALRTWQQGGAAQAGQLYEDVGIDEEEENPDDRPLIRHLVSIAAELGSPLELARNDSKYQAFLGALLKLAPGEKVVVFAYFKATLYYLEERLRADGLRPIVLSGDSGADKGRILEDFAKESGPDILLSSEVGSEGVDLQFSRIVVNYDLPWNPMKVEQRIGRIDRIGQKSDVISILNLFYEDTVDARIYERLFERLDLFRYALGDLEEILGEEIRQLTGELLSRDLTPEQERARIDQTAAALANIRRQEEQLEAESASLVAYGDYILNQVRAARDLNRWIRAEDIFGFVRTVFGERYPGCTFYQPDPGRLLVDVLLREDTRHDLEGFIREHRLHTSTRLSGLSSAPVKCLFENRLATKAPTGVEIIDQTHPLTRFACKVAEELASARRPAVSIRLKRSHLSGEWALGDYIFMIQKWMFDGLQQTERLHYAVIPDTEGGAFLAQQEAERLFSAAIQHGEDWIEAGSVLRAARLSDLGSACLDHANSHYEQHVTDIRNQNQDRIDIHVKNLENHLQSQLDKYAVIRDRHQLAGRTNLVSATEGKMRLLEERVRRKRRDAEDHRAGSSRTEDICAGVVRLE